MKSEKQIKWWLLILLVTLSAGELRAQMSARQITFHLDTAASTFYDPVFKDTAVNAYKIVCWLFSSAEFQQQLAQLSFKCQAYSDGCGVLPQNGNRVTGSTVLDMLFKKSQVTDTLNLVLNNHQSGLTTVFTNVTEADHDPIVGDMPELPFTYALAVNLCHEYMHSLGFIHLYAASGNPFGRHLHEVNGQPDMHFYNDDVTYRIGWIVYYILKNRYDHHLPLN